MSIAPGRYSLGPEHGTLSVRTGRTGAVARAGHDLLIRVQSWSATIEAGDGPEQTSMRLSADPRSLRVLEGTGGMASLDEDDKRGIAQTIDEEVLKGSPIEFSSGAVTPGAADGLNVEGELELGGGTHPVSFELLVAGGRVTGAAKLKQSDFGIKPYSALFGTLKVADEVAVEVDAELRPA